MGRPEAETPELTSSSASKGDDGGEAALGLRFVEENDDEETVDLHFFDVFADVGEFADDARGRFAHVNVRFRLRLIMVLLCFHIGARNLEKETVGEFKALCES